MDRHRMMRLCGAGIVAGMAAVFVAAGPASAAGTNLVVNGNFAQPDVGDQASQSVTAVPGWDLPTGSAEIDGAVANGNSGGFTPPAGSMPGTQSSDLNLNSAGSLQQTITTTPGTSYALDFDLAGNPPTDGQDSSPAQKTGVVRVDGAMVGDLNFDATGKTHSDMGWEHRQYVFTATSSSTTIGFYSTTVGTLGPVITNVAVTQVPDAGAPMASVPAMWALGGGALLLLGAWWLRRPRRNNLRPKGMTR